MLNIFHLAFKSRNLYINLKWVYHCTKPWKHAEVCIKLLSRIHKALEASPQRVLKCVQYTQPLKKATSEYWIVFNNTQNLRSQWEVTTALLPLPSLCCSPVSCYVALLLYLLDIQRFGGKEGELWLLMLVGKGYLYLQLVRCLISRYKSGVAKLCLVMIEMNFYLGLYQPWLGQGRKILMLPSHTPLQNLHLLLFIKLFDTQYTVLNGS
jgi:hypothetical protein